MDFKAIKTVVLWVLGPIYLVEEALMFRTRIVNLDLIINMSLLVFTKSKPRLLYNTQTLEIKLLLEEVLFSAIWLEKIQIILLLVRQL